LAKIILGVVKPDRGLVLEPSKPKIGYVPQKFAVPGGLPMDVTFWLRLGIPGISYKIINEIVQELSIEHLLHHQVGTLSGGELQRVLLAKSLLNKPDILLLDEPTQAGDAKMQSEFYALLEKLRNEHGIAIMLISHDLYMVMRTTDRVICLNHHICCEGNPEDISSTKGYMDMFGLYVHRHDNCHHL
jgi:zinc transport system ATP-binding protein